VIPKLKGLNSKVKLKLKLKLKCFEGVRRAYVRFPEGVLEGGFPSRRWFCRKEGGAVKKVVP
jgi:hypothetical protein